MKFPDAAAISEAAKQAVKWTAENPKSATMYGVAGIAMAAPAVVAGPALAAAGFGANGIAAGSLAAGAQAGIGNVAAGSAFATLQSAGMAGYGVAIVNGVVQAGGAAVAIATGGVAAAKAKLGKTPDTPDITIIEGPWAWLKHDVCERITVEEHLIDIGGNAISLEAMEQSWASIPEDMVDNLVRSVPQQIESSTKAERATEY
ncbi:hypothetical protein F5Y06DRAFT_279464 [Hypoxylon sp. FL0890]|nr:hypothetical protein F5Y06DRAFT_279464 [Hypoxylon sp. FL0890]